jgi:phage-related protein
MLSNYNGGEHMYEVEYYTTDSGNIPYEDYKIELAKKNKILEIAQMEMAITHLKQYGFDISKKIGGKMIKALREGVFELRPGGNRVMFFHFNGNRFVILHAFQKTTNKTPNHEIDLAIKEKKKYQNKNH